MLSPILDSNTISFFHKMNQSSLRKMANSRVGIGKIQDEPGISCSAENKNKCETQRMGACHRG
jgi:hypothetical protein